ncbi:MAG: plasma-membrane proton-efflux P-type ATPase [Euryarchaeota archaeon]|nr:plasma-membrane proton-efflux P-type ATPase [Euryarchaeota archaeon]
MAGKDYKDMSVEEVLREFNTDPEHGLSSAEVKKRLEKYGYNEIPEKKVNPVIKFLSYFWGPIPWMIEIAAILSALIQHWVDFWIIFSLLLVNGIIGFWQEHKAENIIEFLKNKLSLTARVLRDGEWKTIPARELVPGDIVRIRMGDIAPADIKLLDGDYVNVDESVLTGESVPVSKKRGEIVYSGSHVKRGEMTGVVVATGLHTYFGKTVQLVQIAKSESKYQKLVTKIGNYLILITIFLVSAVAIVQLHRGMDPLELLRFSLVLVVAAIPAALPAVLSITMAIGAYELAKKHAIVTKLVAIEELAGVDTLCADKTGTLTLNKLTVGEVIPLNGHTSEDVILYASLASVEENKDPIDLAVLGAMKKMSLESVYKKYKQLKFTPFDPVIKRTEAVVRGDDGEFSVAKGAPQVILQLTEADEQTKEKVSEIVNENAHRGYRIIGVAVKKTDKWELVGLIPLYDPPRKDAAETIRFLKENGIRVKMITGDHLSIAQEIAKQLDIGKNIYPYQVLKASHQSKREEFIERADGFAEVFPEHKFTIVETLQKNGHTVAMTGDGVNDAPALKKADVGIAVAGATDAARSAAGIALLKEGISVIKDAVVTSRKIFKRMYSYVIYRITETIRVLFFITLAILAFNFYPITPVLIILLALLNDIPILTIAYDNVKIDKKPEKWEMHKILTLSTALGLLGVIETFLLLWIAVKYFGISTTNNVAMLQTLIFLKLAVAGHLTIFVTRTKGPFWSIMPGKGLLWSAVGTKALATVIAVYGFGLAGALPLWLAGFIWLYCIFWFFVEDATKQAVYKMMEGHHLFGKSYF